MKRKWIRFLSLILVLLSCTVLFSGCDESTVSDIVDIVGAVLDDGQSGAVETEPASQSQALSLEQKAAAMVEKNGEYSDRDHVAAYLIVYDELPSNYITKSQAKKLGWDSSSGNLWDVAPGKSIGGDTFGNYEGLLPEGNYHECDINYEGGFRGAERIIFEIDGAIYFTDDHYASFTKLYPEE